MLFEKTDEGRKAIQTRHVRLTPCQRAVLITVNGSQSHAELVATATKMGGQAADVEHLLGLGLISQLILADTQPAAFEPPAMPPEVEPVLTPSAKISLESLWPQSVSAEVAAQDLVAIEGSAFAPIEEFDQVPQASATPDLEAVKYFALELLQPMGLRTIQLRRTVEAAQTPAQLREVMPLIRDLLNDEQRMQLDSAFFGLN